jgi:hypothetical protein
LSHLDDLAGLDLDLGRAAAHSSERLV